MKIRGIVISIGVRNFPHKTLGVIPLDIDVPEELTKTQWTPLELVVEVITSQAKFSDIVQIAAGGWDGSFSISQEMIFAAVGELEKRINAQRVELTAPPFDLTILAQITEALEQERWHDAKTLVANLREKGVPDGGS